MKPVMWPMWPQSPRKFVLHWLGGKTENVEGDNIADAMNKAGYGAGALAALDYYEEVVTAEEPKP